MGMKCIPSPRTSLLVPPPSVLKTIPRLPDSTVGQRQPGRNGATASEARSSVRRKGHLPVGTGSLPGCAAIHHRERLVALEDAEEDVEGREEEERAPRERPEERDLRRAGRAGGGEGEVRDDEVRVLRGAPAEDDERGLHDRR